jgi:hypothetical protein
MDTTLLLIVGYFALLALTLRKRWGTVDGPWLFFFRAFFPNWKFYHGINPAPRLYARGQSAHGAWTAWQLIAPRARLSAHHLLHNPAVNLALAHQNLVDHLAHDINSLPEGADIREKVTYQLVGRWAQQALCGARWGEHPMIHAAPLRDMTAFQFEIRMELPLGNHSELMLQSPEMRPWN